jgi:hypothetical protein
VRCYRHDDTFADAHKITAPGPRLVFFVMARLVRATCRGAVLVQVARTSRAMTLVGMPVDSLIVGVAYAALS